MFNAIIGAVIDSARAEQEPVMVGTAVNVDKNGSNLNIPEGEATIWQQPLLNWKQRWKQKEEEEPRWKLERAWFSAQSVQQKSVGHVEARGPPRP